MRLGLAVTMLAAAARAAVAGAQSADAESREPVGGVASRPPTRLLTARERFPHAEAEAPDFVFTAPGIPGSGSIQELYVMNLDGSGRRQLTSDGLSKFLPHFSPDGRRILSSKFLAGQYGDPNAETDIVVFDLDEGAERRLTWTGEAFAAAWSPDGTRIAYGTYRGDSLWIMDADGSNPRLVGTPSGAEDDQRWNDFAWSSDDWILFTVGQFAAAGGCFNVRLDKIRSDGTDRTRVTDGGGFCTPPGREQNGDADPGFSPDGRTIYSSRGFPFPPPGFPAQVVRRIYAFSSDAWTPGKLETDLSIPSAPDCIEGVPKASPDGTRILLFRGCAGEPWGITLTDATGSFRQWITDGFGADWNPAAARESTNQDLPPTSRRFDELLD